jgi:16S rRNA (guanine1516-N2)-methyltransferase
MYFPNIKEKYGFSMAKIAIATEMSVNKAKNLAKRLNLPITDINSTVYDFLLVITESRLELREISKQRTKPLYVDFLHGKAAHRRKYGGGRGQLIARAVGIKKGRQLTVLDATAGLGRDAYVLASLGCKMILIERSPIIAALLEDGLQHIDLDMQLIITDAIPYMQNLPPNKKPDVVYLDPMHPLRTKSALVKKEMRILRKIVGQDEDAEQLLAIALKTARNRVVVKRPRLAPEIKGPKPDLIFKGKTCRFDVYLP